MAHLIEINNGVASFAENGLSVQRTAKSPSKINSSNTRSKRHQLAHALHVLNDNDFQAAFAFYFLKAEYTSVQYDNGIAERIEIKYTDIAE